MTTEDERIQFDDLKHRDYKTLSPSKKSSNIASTAGDVGENLVENDKFGQNLIDRNEIEEKVVDEEAARPKRVPRRVLHFSDGILEEYSTDEDDEEVRRNEMEVEEKKKKQQIIDPKSLTWIPWMIHYTWFAGSSVLNYCDSWGEKLAWFFGITSPKYYYELEEFKRMKEEEEEKKSKLESEMHGWTESNANPEIVGTDPTKTHETSQSSIEH